MYTSLESIKKEFREITECSQCTVVLECDKEEQRKDMIVMIEAYSIHGSTSQWEEGQRLYEANSKTKEYWKTNINS
jgi:hypothetical protein